MRFPVGFTARRVTRAARLRTPSEARRRFHQAGAVILALSENIMRALIHFAATALLIAVASFAFAQGASIQIEQPWARATPAGASTAAVYLTIDNKSHDPDRLIGGSSDVADKLQIHEMKVVNGTMEMREVTGVCQFQPAGRPCSSRAAITSC
jgi:Copper chaperone PCu(A)C